MSSEDGNLDSCLPLHNKVFVDQLQLACLRGKKCIIGDKSFFSYTMVVRNEVVGAYEGPLIGNSRHHHVPCWKGRPAYALAYFSAFSTSNNPRLLHDTSPPFANRDLMGTSDTQF